MHHTRRRSGHGLPSSSMTDVRKAVSDAPAKHKPSKQTSSSSRRSVPKTSKPSGRDAEKEQDDDEWFDDERESFPQYCMTCEKQFVAKDDRFLYCSEACRDYDQEYGSTISTQHLMDSYANKGYSIYTADATEPRDLIPRASPSRPSSNYFSPPPTPAKAASTLHTSSAMASLRSLSIRDASPPSPSMAPASSGIWPFASRSMAANSSSYARPAAMLSATYDHGYYYQTGAERPLPPRRPGSYSRPKSIELVTPLISQ